MIFGREGKLAHSTTGTGTSHRLALDLNDHAVTLYSESSPGIWLRLGEAWVDTDGFDAQMAELRQKAKDQLGPNHAVTLWMPPEQVLTMRARLKGKTESARLNEAVEIFDTESVYKSGYLSVAVSPPNDAGESVLLAALTQSCEEARAHARSWGFVAGEISTRHDADRFGTHGPEFRRPDEVRVAPWPRARVFAGGAVAAALAFAAIFSSDDFIGDGSPGPFVAPAESFYALGTPSAAVAKTGDLDRTASADGPPYKEAEPEKLASLDARSVWTGSAAEESPLEPDALRVMDARPLYRLERDILRVGNGPQVSVPPNIQRLASRAPNAAELPGAERPYIDLERTADPVNDKLVLDLPVLSASRLSEEDLLPVKLAQIGGFTSTEDLLQVALAPTVTPEPPAPHAVPRRQATTSVGSRVAPESGVPQPRFKPALDERDNPAAWAVHAEDVVPLAAAPALAAPPARPTISAQGEPQTLVALNVDALPTSKPIAGPRGSDASPGQIAAVPAVEPAPEPDANRLAAVEPSQVDNTPAPVTPEATEETAEALPAATEVSPADAEPPTTATVAALTAPTTSAAPSPRATLPNVRQLPKVVNRGGTVYRQPPAEPQIIDGAPALVGVLNLTGGRQALIRLPSGRYRRVEVGDSLDGWQISSIGQRDLRLELDGETITLPLIAR